MRIFSYCWCFLGPFLRSSMTYTEKCQEEVSRPHIHWLERLSLTPLLPAVSALHLCRFSGISFMANGEHCSHAPETEYIHSLLNLIPVERLVGPHVHTEGKGRFMSHIGDVLEEQTGSQHGLVKGYLLSSVALSWSGMASVEGSGARNCVIWNKEAPSLSLSGPDRRQEEEKRRMKACNLCLSTVQSLFFFKSKRHLLTLYSVWCDP